MIYPSGTVALLVVGLQSSYESRREAIEQLNQMFSKHCGYLFAKNDLTFKLAFKTLNDALQFALSVKSEIPNTFSIGIDCGYVSLEEKETGEVIYGGCVMNNALYFSERAGKGELVTSRSCYEKACETFSDKKLSDKFKVEESIRTNLVEHGQFFVGRRDDFRNIDRLFQKDSSLVTVTGPKGSGKTGLSQNWGISKLDEFPAGVWFVDLSEAKSVKGLCADLAVVLSTTLEGAEPIQHLGKVLHGMCKSVAGPILILLDNCKHITVEVAEALRIWMKMAPHVNFLVTNRKALDSPDEKKLALGGLKCPSEREIETCKDLLGFAAVQVFYSRCQELYPDFKMNQNNLKDIARVCRKLDGRALAIELAATLIEFFSPDMLLTRLKTGKEKTIDVVLSWTWDILKADEKQVLAQLSIFKKAFSFDAVQRVLDLSNLAESPDVLDVLSRLKKKGFVKPHDFKVDNGDSMWHLHDSVRDFAFEKLKDFGTFAEIELRWQTWLLDYSRYWWKYYQNRTTAVVVQRMNQVLEDLINLSESCEIEEEEAAWALVYASPFISSLGMGHSAIPLLENCFKRLGISIDGLAKSNFGVTCGVDEELVSYMVLSYGMFHLNTDPLKAIDIFSTLENNAYCNEIALCCLARAYVCEGEMLKACECAYSLLEKEELNPNIFIRTKNVLCSALTDIGEFDEAMIHLRDALEVSEEVELDMCREFLIGNLGIIYLAQGRDKKALTMFEEAYQLAESYNACHNRPVWLGNMSEIYIRLNQKDKAFSCARKALALAQELRQPKSAAIWRGNVGLCYARFRIDHNRAIQKIKAAIDTFRKVNARNYLSVFLGHMGSVYIDQVVYGLIDFDRFEDNCQMALECFEEAEEIRKQYSLQRQFSFEADMAYCKKFFGDEMASKQILQRALKYAQERNLNENSQSGRFSRQFEFCYHQLGEKTVQG